MQRPGQEERRMKKHSVERLAAVLRVLVTIALICNLVILYLVPVAVVSGGTSLPDSVLNYLNGLFRPGEDDIVAAAAAASFLAWFWVWKSAYQAMLTLFLVVSGVCTAVILRQARNVLGSILREEPFSLANAMDLRRAAVCRFLISGAALVRVIFNMAYYASLRPLASYNTLFIPLFAMFGLLCLVMSALFRQAADLKAENDLTI